MTVLSLFSALLPAILLLPFTAGYETYPITGAKGFGTHPRLEIRTLHQENPAQWNIYLLALRVFYSQAEHEKLSYFQIGAIHGEPNIAWDGVKNITRDGIGYCAHTSTIFLPWHRPYMALYEQRLQHFAMQEARKFKGQDQAKYLAAAKTLRAAYWDWGIDPANGQEVFPRILSDKHVSVHTPNGHELIPNPFYQYSFHPNRTKGFVKEPWTIWPRTLRYASTHTADAVSVERKVTKSFQNVFKPIQELLFQFFSDSPHWLDIDNLDKMGSSSNATGLEDIHGVIHVFVGWNGHMADLKYAGFDPVFWLHHCNVDRYFAMWQSIHPEKYVVKRPASFATFTYRKGEIMDENTPLQPFHSDDRGTFWTSKQVRNTEVFHYTYPELMNGGNRPAAMRKQINELYGPNATRHAVGPKGRRRSRSINDISRKLADLDVNNPFLAINGSSFQYFAKVQSTRFGLGGSYGIYMFFTDPVSEEPSTWLSDPNFAGTYQILSTSGMEDVDIVATGTVPLTNALNEQVRKGKILSMAEEFVVPFLTDKLQWRVVGPAGIELDPSSVPSFKLEVAASTLALNTDPTEFPVWSPFVPLPEITRGKPGGARF